MRKVVVCNLLSLDGYVAGPGGDLSGMPFDTGFSEYNLERLEAADTFLLGRRTFEGFRQYWPSKVDDSSQPALERDIARVNTAIEKLVVSDTLRPENADGWGPVRIIRRADAHAEVAALRQQEGKEIHIHGSHVLWNDLLAHGLVDELHFLFGAGAIAGGVAAFEKPVRGLRLIETRRFDTSNLVLLRYAVDNSAS